MLVMIERLLEIPIMSLQTGARLAVTNAPIIDPRELKIVAFYVKGPLVGNDSIVLHPEDIREISQLGVIVDDDGVLMETTDLVRLQEVIDFNFQLTNTKVADERGKNLGRVSNYAVETESFTIQQIHVSQSLLKSFSSSGLIIRRSQIVKITNELIIVKSPTVTEDPVNEQSVERQKSFSNPFRSPQAQNIQEHP